MTRIGSTVGAIRAALTALGDQPVHFDGFLLNLEAITTGRVPVLSDGCGEPAMTMEVPPHEYNVTVLPRNVPVPDPAGPSHCPANLIVSAMREMRANLPIRYEGGGVAVLYATGDGPSVVVDGVVRRAVALRAEKMTADDRDHVWQDFVIEVACERCGLPRERAAEFPVCCGAPKRTLDAPPPT